MLSPTAGLLTRVLKTSLEEKNLDLRHSSCVPCSSKSRGNPPLRQRLHPCFQLSVSPCRVTEPGPLPRLLPDDFNRNINTDTFVRATRRHGRKRELVFRTHFTGSAGVTFVCHFCSLSPLQRYVIPGSIFTLRETRAICPVSSVPRF